MSHHINCYLDRFEGEMAVLLIDGREAVITRSILPREISAGDYLRIDILIDPTQRQSVSDEISDLQEKLKPQDGEPE